jgi:hypothetical protein
MLAAEAVGLTLAQLALAEVVLVATEASPQMEVQQRQIEVVEAEAGRLIQEQALPVVLAL